MWYRGGVRKSGWLLVAPVFFLTPFCALNESGLGTDGATPDVAIRPDVSDAPVNDVGGDASSDVGADQFDAPFDAGFSPTSLAGLVLWLRADLGVSLNGGKVSAWADQSGNGNNAQQASSANQPSFNATAPSLNNSPTLSFVTANANFLQIPDAVSLRPTNITLAIVARYTSQADYQSLIAHTTSGSWMDGWGLTNGPVANAGQFEFWVDNDQTADSLGVVPLGSWHLFTGTFDGTSVVLSIDNNAQPATPWTSNITYPATTATLIGAYWGVGSMDAEGYASMDVAEIAIYNQGLGNVEVSELHQYVVARYGTP
jgi:Concanavalin A-like lectin/glucanases superfamily